MFIPAIWQKRFLPKTIILKTVPAVFSIELVEQK
jgi:hypothetical protein